MNKLLKLIYGFIYYKQLNFQLYAREFCTWTSVYDKYNNLLDTPIERPISQLTDEHLNNIVKFVKLKKRRVPHFIKYEILLRRLHSQFRIKESDDLDI